MRQRALMEPRKINQQVIDDCRQGDREAFRLLFEAYKDKVFSIAIYSFRGDEAAARDITQQVFLKLMNSITQFRGDSEFSTWLYRLVVNACTDEQRRRRRFFPLQDWTPRNHARVQLPQEKQYARVELGESVQNAIGELKPKFRLPVLLKYVEGLSYEEIAAVLECSTGTVASRLNRAHKMLAKRLGHLRDQVVLGE